MPILNYTTTVSADKSVQEINLPQLRMQALTLLKDIIRPSIPLIDVNKDLYNTADQLVHYCLTGEHQLPEKKE